MRRPEGFHLLALIIAALDLVSKEILFRILPPAGYTLLPGVLNLVKVHNPGVAFGLFREWGGILWSFIGLLAAGAIFWWGRGEKDQGRRVALGLVAGGALGNALDRLWHGAVFDFVDLHWGVHHWPAFNLADTAITLGIGLYLWRLRA